MRISFYLVVVSILSLTAGACEGNGGQDGYIRSLKLRPQVIAPADSIDLERIGFYSLSGLVKCGNWFLTSEYPRKTHNLTAFEPEQGAVLRFLPFGRSAGEIAMPARVTAAGGKVSVFDVMSNTVVAVDVEPSVQTGKQVLDTLSCFSGSWTYTDPIPCRDGLIATTFNDGDSWYALVDPAGKTLSSVGKIGDPLLKGDDFPALTMTNSLATVSPDGTRVCYASMLLTALSFSRIEGGRLEETCRIERTQERKETFRSICSDDALVYILYTGKSEMTSGSNEADWLVVYDWEGRLQKCYRLTHAAWAVAVEGGKAYCLSNDPNCKIYVYQLK